MGVGARPGPARWPPVPVRPGLGRKIGHWLSLVVLPLQGGAGRSALRHGLTGRSPPPRPRFSAGCDVGVSTIGTGSSWSGSGTDAGPAMTSASSIVAHLAIGGGRGPRVVDAATRPQMRQTVVVIVADRASKRAGDPAGWIRRMRPTSTRTPSTSYTAWIEMEPISALTVSATASAVMWGSPETARKTVKRWPVTR
jgi:hypothetical protein